jgi:hypothetical protein
MLPRALAERCRKQNIPVAVIALRGAADVKQFEGFYRTELPIGGGRAMVRFFRDHKVRDIVMIGAVRRPSLFDIRPDWWTLWRLGPTLLRGGLGDDGLLRVVRRVFEGQGFRVQGIQTYLPDLIAAAGPMGQHAPDDTARYDIKRGFNVARLLGAADVGQAVVVQGGIVLAVEAAEGTDALIKRAGALKRSGPGPVLIKAAKPQQDRALDLPTIGPDTVAAAIDAGFAGIAVEAGGTLIVEPVKMVERADAAGFFIHGHTTDTV